MLPSTLQDKICLILIPSLPFSHNQEVSKLGVKGTNDLKVNTELQKAVNLLIHLDNSRPADNLIRHDFQKCMEWSGGASRWRKSKTWRSPSSPRIHRKYIYTWNNSYRTPIECWQKTSVPPKGKKLPTYLGRAKEKRKNRDKRIGTGPAPLGGSCEGGKVSTH